MVIRVQIPAQIVTVGSFRNLFRHADLHYIALSAAASESAEGPARNPTPISSSSMSVQVQVQRPVSEGIIANAELDRERCVSEIWELVSNAADSDHDDHSSRRIEPQQLNQFLTTLSKVLIRNNPELKGAIEDHFCASARNTYVSVNQDQFRIILDDLEGWYLDISETRSPHSCRDQVRRTFWQTICDGISIEASQQQQERIPGMGLSHKSEQPRYIIVKKSALTRSRNSDIDKPVESLGKSTRSKARISSLHLYQTDTNSPHNVQLQLQIPLVAAQSESNCSHTDKDPNQEQVAVQLDSQLQMSNPEPSSIELPPLESDPVNSDLHPEAPRKRRSAMNVKAKPRVDCWIKAATPLCAKENVETVKEAKVDRAISSSGRICHLEQSQKRRELTKLVTPIQPTMGVLRDCALFNHSSRQTVRVGPAADVIPVVRRSSPQTLLQPVQPSAEFERQRSATATMIFLNQLDTSLISKASNSFHFRKVSANSIMMKPKPSAIRRYRSLSSLSSYERPKIQNSVDVLDNVDFDPFHDHPEGWLVVSADEEGQLQEPRYRNHYQQPNPDYRLNPTPDRRSINRQWIQPQRQRDGIKSTPFDQIHVWKPRIQHTYQLESIYRSEEEQSLRPATVDNDVQDPISGKVTWKTSRAAQTRRRVHRRVRLSGWELSAMLVKLGQSASLQVNGQSCS